MPVPRLQAPPPRSIAGHEHSARTVLLPPLPGAVREAARAYAGARPRPCGSTQLSALPGSVPLNPDQSPSLPKPQHIARIARLNAPFSVRRRSCLYSLKSWNVFHQLQRSRRDRQGEGPARWGLPMRLLYVPYFQETGGTHRFSGRGFQAGLLRESGAPSFTHCADFSATGR